NPDPIGLGDLLTYTLTVTNRRAVDAAGVGLLMPVPEGLYSTAGCRAVTDGGTVPAACTAGRDVEWDLGGIPAGGSRTVQFVGLGRRAGPADGSLIPATAHMEDVTGAAARTGVTNTVQSRAPRLRMPNDDRDPAGRG